MKVLARRLFVETSELAELGVPYESIKNSVSYQRRKGGKGWIHIPHPDHSRRRLLILYSSVPKRIKNLYSLPSEAEMLERYKKEVASEQKLKALLAKQVR